MTDEKPKIDLKSLPEHLEYAFLEDGKQKLVIIASGLAKHEKESLVEVLKKKTRCHSMEDNQHEGD